MLRSHIQRSCSYKSAVRLSLRSARAFKLLPAQVPSRCAGVDRGHGHAGHCARVRSACSHVVLACYGNTADGRAHLRCAVSERARSKQEEQRDTAPRLAVYLGARSLLTPERADTE